jgi:hypothetical protein
MRRTISWRSAVAVVMVLQAVLLSAVLRRSYFREDDYWFLAALAEKPFWSYLFQNNAGHLMPGQLLIVALVQWVSPLNFTVVVVMLVGLQGLATVVLWKLLCELVGASGAALTGIVVFAFSPLATVASVWYAGALQVVPLQLAVAGVLLHHVRFIRTRRSREVAYAGAWFLLAIFMWEKGLVSLLLAALITLLWFPCAKGVRGALAAFRRDQKIWAVYAAVVGVYLPCYVVLTTQVKYPRPTFHTYALAVWRALTGGAIPYLLGGPFASARPAVVNMTLVSHGEVYLVVFAIIVAATMVRRRAAWRAWTMVGLSLVVNSVVITSARGGYFGSLIGLLPRYFGDLTLVAALAVPLALAPVRPSAAVSAKPAGTAAVGGRALVGAVVALVYAVMGFVTSNYAVSGLSGGSIHTFVKNARRDLSALGDVVVYDAATPPFVNAAGSSRQVLLATELPVRFAVPTPQLYTLDFDGHLRPSIIGGGTTGKVDGGECGTRIANGTRATIDLHRHLFAWRWVVRLDYTLNANAAVVVTAAGERHGAVLRAADHQLFVEVTGALDHIDVGVLGGDAPLCLSGVTVGTVEPQATVAG